MTTSQKIIDQTKKWVNDVVIGCQFCPFAAHVIKQKKVHFNVEKHTTIEDSINAILREIIRLEADINIETSFLIFPDGFEQFDDSLNLPRKGRSY